MKVVLFWLFHWWSEYIPLRSSVDQRLFMLIVTLGLFANAATVQAVELKRTSIGSYVGATVVKWKVSNGVVANFTATNLNDNTKYLADDLKCNFDKTILSCKFTTAGIYTIKIDGAKEIIQIISPAPNKIEDFDKPDYFTACQASDTYDVIVVDGTSAGIGAAITAAREGLKTCLLESSSLVGGMFTNGLGISDIGVDSQAGLNKPISTGLLYGFMKDFANEVKAVIKTRNLSNSMTNLSSTTERESIDGGLVFRPSVARQAVYNLLKNNNVNVQINSIFESIVRENDIYTVTASGLKYKAKYIIDATDSGDVAVAYYMQKYGKTEKALFDESQTSPYCKTLDNTDITENGLLQDKPEQSDPATVPRFCVRNPPQAYSYIMTIHPYDKEDDNWSYMAYPPPNCFNHKVYGATGVEGEYYTNMYKNSEGGTSWTFETGGLGDKMYQVKHHSKLGTYSVDAFRKKYEPNLISSDINKADCGKDATEFARLGDELVDCNAHGTDVKTGYAVDSSARSAVGERYLNHTLCLLYHVQQQDAAINNKSIGLTINEDPVRGNFPARMYVREGRRINGKATFFGSDTLKRTLKKVNGKFEPGDLLNGGRPQPSEYTYQGIGITGYAMDSHGASPEDSAEGKVPYATMASVTTVGVVPLGAMMPNDVSNMFVPLAMSSSAWGYTTIRMDPARANMGQVAALAIKFAEDNKSNNITTDTLVEKTDVGKQWLVKFQSYLLENGGKFFLYKDNEFQNPNDEQKKAHMAAQFLGIWGIMSGYGVKNDITKDVLLYPAQSIYPIGGYILGYGANLNRSEMTKTMLLGGLFAGNEQLKGADQTACNETFDDVSSSDWACPYITYAKTHQLLDGRSEKSFGTYEDVTEAELTKFIVKFIFDGVDVLTPYLKENVGAPLNILKTTYWYKPYRFCIDKHDSLKYLFSDEPGNKMTRAKVAQVIRKAIEVRNTASEPRKICEEKKI